MHSELRQRVIGYDNERPKGDHRHFHVTEEPYDFTTPEQLIDDFLVDVENERIFGRLPMGAQFRGF